MERRALPLPTSVMRRRMENYDDGIKSHRYFLSPSLSLTLPKDFDFLLETRELECSAVIMREVRGFFVQREHEYTQKEPSSC